MKKRINLFVSKIKAEEIPPLFKKVRLYGLYVMAVFAVVLLGLGFGLFQLSSMNSEARAKQEQLVAFVEQNKALERKIAQFVYKKQLYRNFLRDDAQFSLYYSLLQKVLTEIEGSPTLESFALDKNHKTNFLVTFTDYEAANQFVTRIESPTFLKFFKEMKLQSFTTTVHTNKSVTYELKFEGEFNAITETKTNP